MWHFLPNFDPLPMRHLVTMIQKFGENVMWQSGLPLPSPCGIWHCPRSPSPPTTLESVTYYLNGPLSLSFFFTKSKFTSLLLSLWSHTFNRLTGKCMVSSRVTKSGNKTVFCSSRLTLLLLMTYPNCGKVFWKVLRVLRCRNLRCFCIINSQSIWSRIKENKRSLTRIMFICLNWGHQNPINIIACFLFSAEWPRKWN